MWFSSGALRALSHLLSAARVVCWPCLVASELKLAVAVRIDCLGTSPILLLLLLHRDRATALQADEEADHDPYPLMFVLQYCIDPTSTVHCIFFCRIEIWRPTYKLTKRRSTTASQPRSGVCAAKLYRSSWALPFPDRDFSALEVDE